MRYGFNLGFASSLYSRFREWATHVFTGTLLPTGTEVKTPLTLGDSSAFILSGASNISDKVSNYEFNIVINEPDASFRPWHYHYVEGANVGDKVTIKYEVTIDSQLEIVGVIYQAGTHEIIKEFEYVSINYGGLQADSVNDITYPVNMNVKITEVYKTSTGLLKDTGKQKQNLTVNSGAMTLFNGVDQNIPASLATQNNSTAHSVSLIFKTSDIITQQYLYFSGSSTYNKNRFKWASVDNGALIIKAGDISVNVLSLEVDKIYTYTDTYDGETLKVYINSTEVYSGLCTYVDTDNGFRWTTDRNASLFPLLNISCGLLLPQALTPKQVKYIHDYPHKAVAHYNINDTYTTPSLPDVTASLNMPLTEVGKYKIDYSKAFGGELVQDNTLITNLGANWIGDDGGLLSVVNGALRITESDPSVGYAAARQYNIPTEVGKTYLLYGVGSGFDTISIGPTSGSYNGYFDNGDISSGVYFTATRTSCYITLHTNKSTPGDYKDFKGYITLRQATAYEVANYTTSANLTQQDDGLQMIAFKQNNGILEKLQDDRMNLTGEERPALPLDMTDTELYENGEFSIGFVIKRTWIAKNRFLLYSRDGGSPEKGFHLLISAAWSENYTHVAIMNQDNTSTNIGFTMNGEYHHIIFTLLSTEALITIDGIDNTPKTHNFAPSGLSLKDSLQQSPKCELTDFKIWKKALTVEERAKEWAKAQKTIAELETLEVQYV